MARAYSVPLISFFFFYTGLSVVSHPHSDVEQVRQSIRSAAPAIDKRSHVHGWPPPSGSSLSPCRAGYRESWCYINLVFSQQNDTLTTKQRSRWTSRSKDGTRSTTRRSKEIDKRAGEMRPKERKKKCWRLAPRVM